jgi:hypothetical protein
MRAAVLLLPLVALLALATAGCESPASKALRLDEDHAALRELQTRRFDTRDDAMMMRSCAALLQDLGFTLQDSETAVGLIVGIKDRTAVEAQQVAGAVAGTVMLTVLAILTGSSGDTSVAYDERQRLRASVITYGTPSGVCVRVTFQRTVWDSKGRVSRLESLQEPKHYEEFFSRLSKAVFLEAHGL